MVVERKVALTIDDAGAAPPGAGEFSLETAFGSVKPSARPEDFDELARRAKDAKAEEHLEFSGPALQRCQQDGGS